MTAAVYKSVSLPSSVRYKTTGLLHILLARGVVVTSSAQAAKYQELFTIIQFLHQELFFSG